MTLHENTTFEAVNQHISYRLHFKTFKPNFSPINNGSSCKVQDPLHISTNNLLYIHFFIFNSAFGFLCLEPHQQIPDILTYLGLHYPSVYLGSRKLGMA